MAGVKLYSQNWPTKGDLQKQVGLRGFQNDEVFKMNSESLNRIGFIIHLTHRLLENAPDQN